MANAPKKRAHARVGTVVREKYRLETLIAMGSMANVYAATHRNGSRVALKILYNELSLDPAMIERFQREAYFANVIGHPGVVRAIDDDMTDDGCPFIVMELLEGENLEERRQRLGGKLLLGDVLMIADAILDILTAAHARDVLHRDLKPDNVFLTHSGEVKLLDFGVARWNDGKGASDTTGIGMVFGTPAFMPPEQALGRRQDVDARSDLWALGATLFTMLSGESVHGAGGAEAKLLAATCKPARPLRNVAPDVPRGVASVIDRALAFDRGDRWQDATTMREALRWARMSQESAPVSIARPSLDPPAPRSFPRPRTHSEHPTLRRHYAVGTDDEAPHVTLRNFPPPAPSAYEAGPTLRPTGDSSFALDQTLPGRVSQTAHTEAFLVAKAIVSSPAVAPAPAPVVISPAVVLPAVVSKAISPTFPTVSSTTPLPAAPRRTAISPFASTRAPAPSPLPGSAPGLVISAARIPVETPVPSPNTSTAPTVTSMPDQPGPLLAQIVPRSRGISRFIVPMMLGLAAGASLYVAALRHRVARSQAAAAQQTTEETKAVSLPAPLTVEAPSENSAQAPAPPSAPVLSPAAGAAPEPHAATAAAAATPSAAEAPTSVDPAPTPPPETHSRHPGPRPQPRRRSTSPGAHPRSSPGTSAPVPVESPPPPMGEPAANVDAHEAPSAPSPAEAPAPAPARSESPKAEPPPPPFQLPTEIP